MDLGIFLCKGEGIQTLFQKAQKIFTPEPKKAKTNISIYSVNFYTSS